MRTFLKLFLLITILTLPYSYAQGQVSRNIKVFHLEKSNLDSENKSKANRVNARGIYLYSFYFKNNAESALKILTNFREPNKNESKYIDFKKTSPQGTAFIKVAINGGFILAYDPDENNGKIIDVKPTDNLDDVITIDLESDSKVMGEALVLAAGLVDKKDVTPHGFSCGNVLTVPPTPIDIDSMYAKSNARFVLSPIVIDRNNPKDTIGFLPARVKDGIDYDPSQVRYMGFDMRHDKFNWNGEGYIRTGMKTRQKDTIYFDCNIQPYDDKKPWKIIGHYWFEDYKTVYHEGSIMLYSGYSGKPTHFLDWKESIPEVELDVSHYSREAQTSSVRESEDLRLQFNRGSADLNYSDSITRVSIERTHDRINLRSSNNSVIVGFAIEGFASPEGSEATNRSLAEKRANTVYREFATRLQGIKNTITSQIVPWTEVADTLETINKDGYAEIATELREICQAKTKLDDQWNIIRSKSWYANTIEKDSILEKMRRVKISLDVIQEKVLTPAEIYGNFEKNRKDYINNAKSMAGTPAYQYYQLLTKLYSIQDWDGLLVAAKTAYDDKTDLMSESTDRHILTEERDSLTNKRKTKKVTITRPYPLAAYYYAKSKLERAEPDTTILLNYLDSVYNGGQFGEKRDYYGNITYWNEEAIAATQIMMYCLLGQYTRADILAQYHLPDREEFRTFRHFLKFLSCDYNDEDVKKTVRESSPINFVVANLVDGDEGFKRALMRMTEHKEEFDTLDATYLYLLAICSYQVNCKKKGYETYYYNSYNVYDPTEAHLKTELWGAPMLEAIKRDPEWAEFLKEDGFFNDAYRAMILFFWQRMQDGLEMEDIAREYDELAKKYFETKKQ